MLSMFDFIFNGGGIERSNVSFIRILATTAYDFAPDLLCTNNCPSRWHHFSNLFTFSCTDK